MKGAEGWTTGLAVAAMGLAACAGDPAAPMPGDPDAAFAAPAPTVDAALPSADAALPTPDAGMPTPTVDASPASARPTTTIDGRPVPTNVSFETAERVTPGDMRWLRDELSATQVDFFVFEGEAGAYYEVTTDYHMFSPDNVIEVYDAERNLIGENDYGSMWPGDAIDARVIIRAPVTGDYFVRVEDPYTPQAFFDSAFSLLYYHLQIRQLGEDEPGFALEGDAAVTPVTMARDEATGYAYATLIGETGNGDDTFSLQGSDSVAMIARMLQSETAPTSMADAWTHAQLVDAQQVVVGRVDSNVGQYRLRPPLVDAAYELQVGTDDTSFTGSDPGFYAIDVVLIDDNPLEQDEPANDAVEGAEAIQLEGTSPQRGLLLTNLPRDDVDWFRVDVEAGHYLGVVCESESTGSLVRGLRAELLDAAGEMLGEATESAELSLEIAPVSIESAGVQNLRLSTEATSTDEASAAWVRCGVTIY